MKIRGKPYSVPSPALFRRLLNEDSLDFHEQEQQKLKFGESVGEVLVDEHLFDWQSRVALFTEVLVASRASSAVIVATESDSDWIFEQLSAQAAVEVAIEGLHHTRELVHRVIHQQLPLLHELLFGCECFDVQFIDDCL